MTWRRGPGGGPASSSWCREKHIRSANRTCNATLLSVGATGSNSAHGNASPGRIGYIYADFMPQITHSSSIIAGFQTTVGALRPLDEANFAGGDLSATSAGHDTPMFQDKLTYDDKAGATAARVWLGKLIQPQQGIPSAIARSGNRTVGAGQVGGTTDSGPFGEIAHYHRARGVGTTGLMFDAAGALRDFEGLYAQGSFKPARTLKLVVGYGESSLYQAPGEDDPTLVAATPPPSAPAATA